MALEGSERKALHAILHEQGGSQTGYVDDSKIAEIADLSIEEVRDCLEILEGKECVQRSVGVGGHSAYITAKGRLELRRSPIVGDARDESTPRRIKVVPKGLRSFDEHDADFFLELAPRPSPMRTGSPRASTSGKLASKSQTPTRRSGWV